MWTFENLSSRKEKKGSAKKNCAGRCWATGALHTRVPVLRLAGPLVGRDLLLACWAGKRFARTEKKDADRGVDHLLLRPRTGTIDDRPGLAMRLAGRLAGGGDGNAVAHRTQGRRPRRRGRLRRGARELGRAATVGAREAVGADQGEARGPR